MQILHFIATPMDTAHYVLSAHAHNLAQYVGKGRQQAARIIELSEQRCSDIDAAARGYVLYRALVLFIFFGAWSITNHAHLPPISCKNKKKRLKSDWS